VEQGELKFGLDMLHARIFPLLDVPRKLFGAWTKLAGWSCIESLVHH
jgi:hypothetical protein